MKTIFDKVTRDELIGRISLLNVNSTAQWGKMNIYQMLNHCTLYDEWILGRVGKGISAQASHKTVHEILTSHGFSHST